MHTPKHLRRPELGSTFMSDLLWCGDRSAGQLSLTRTCKILQEPCIYLPSHRRWRSHWYHRNLMSFDAIAIKTQHISRTFLPLTGSLYETTRNLQNLQGSDNDHTSRSRHDNITEYRAEVASAKKSISLLPIMLRPIPAALSGHYNVGLD
jgi:hypothetical protein